MAFHCFSLLFSLLFSTCTVVARVRRFIDERGKMPSDRYDLRRPFDNFDADGQGSIDREEFEQVLELLFVGEEIDFWDEEVDQLMVSLCC